ncbi:MAG: ribosomal RNA small subunit methyltransferase A [Clostridia bacterium]|nr:ribosomal RNA small subunit methyltransferase A [Clostridia bacterium]
MEKNYYSDAGHPAVIARLMHDYDIRPKKGAGQNFFSDPAMLDAIADAGLVGKKDWVLEIGPGLGALTQRLAARGKQVIAAELDRDLLPVLAETTGGFDNVKILHQDFLRMREETLEELFRDAETVRVVSNLPYNITNEAVQKLLLSELPIASITLLLQKEAALRILAEQGDKQYGVTSMMNRYYAESEILFDVPGECFFPRPGVTSAVIRMIRRQPRPCPSCGKEKLWKTAHACIAMRRKTLTNNLKAAGFPEEDIHRAFDACGLAGGIRGETLGIDTIVRLAEELHDA